MLNIKRQENLFVTYLFFTVVGLSCTFLFKWLAAVLGPFVWPFAPWHGWLAWIVYAVIWLYALIFWAFCWICQYLLWASPLVSLMMIVSRTYERRLIRDAGYKKLFEFHTRNLIRSWDTTGFGKDQLNAFLNVAHLAITAGISTKTLQQWFWTGFSQGKEGALALAGKGITIDYLEESPEMVTSGIRLLIDGKPSPIR